MTDRLLESERKLYELEAQNGLLKQAVASLRSRLMGARNLRMELDRKLEDADNKRHKAQMESMMLQSAAAKMRTELDAFKLGPGVRRLGIVPRNGESET